MLSPTSREAATAGTLIEYGAHLAHHSSAAVPSSTPTPATSSARRPGRTLTCAPCLMGGCLPPESVRTNQVVRRAPVRRNRVARRRAVVESGVGLGDPSETV